MKYALLRPKAKQDLSDAALYYAEQGGQRLGQSMLTAAVDALGPLQRMPGLGSPTLGERCGVPGLRAWGVRGWPLRWFYFERDDHLDVVRLLGDRQDTATILADDASKPV